MKNGLPHSELTPVTLFIDNKSIKTEIIVIIIIVIAEIIIAETILIHFSLLMPLKVL